MVRLVQSSAQVPVAGGDTLDFSLPAQPREDATIFVFIVAWSEYDQYPFEVQVGGEFATPTIQVVTPVSGVWVFRLDSAPGPDVHIFFSSNQFYGAAIAVEFSGVGDIEVAEIFAGLPGGDYPATSAPGALSLFIGAGGSITYPPSWTEPDGYTPALNFADPAIFSSGAVCWRVLPTAAGGHVEWAYPDSGISSGAQIFEGFTDTNTFFGAY